MYYNRQFPDSRLLKDDFVNTFSDPRERFINFPKPTEEVNRNKGWEMQQILDLLIPDDKISQMLKEPISGLLKLLAKKYYSYYQKSQRYINDEDFALLDPFARITESQAMGVKLDRLYENIGNSERVVSNSGEPGINENITQYLTKTVNNGRIDLDIVIQQNIFDYDPEFIIDSWRKLRKDLNNKVIIQNQNGDTVYLGENVELVKKESKNGKSIFEGWRLVKDVASDGTLLIILEAGIFSLDQLEFNEESLVMEKNIFSVELSTDKYNKGYSQDSNSRSGASATFADRFISLNISCTSSNVEKLIIFTDELTFDISKYDRDKWAMFFSRELFEHKALIIEVLTRANKQMSAKVGAFDLYDFIAVAAEKHVNTKLWENVNVRNWSEYLIKNFIASAHLSPLVFASNLIPNSRLDALPPETGEGSLRRKLAEHGVDFTLSLGQLWPEVFSNLTDEQIAVFLDALPSQKQYLMTILKDLDRYEQTGNIDELKLEHQGVYYVMEALKAARVEFPDFGGNYLMQFLYLFRHPSDMEIENIKVAMHDLSNRPSNLIPAYLENEMAGD